MNKYHNGKASGGKGPTPGNSGVKPRPGKESTAAWKTNIGPVGPRRNTVGFREVKCSVKQRMSDDGVPLMFEGDMMPAGGGQLVGGDPSANMLTTPPIGQRAPVGDVLPNVIDNMRRPVGDAMPNIIAPQRPQQMRPWERVVARRRARFGR